MTAILDTEPKVVYSWIPYNFFIRIRKAMADFWLDTIAYRQEFLSTSGFVMIMVYLFMLTRYIMVVYSLVYLGKFIHYGVTEMETKPAPANYLQNQLFLHTNESSEEAKLMFQQKSMIAQSYLRVFETGMASVENGSAKIDDYLNQLQSEYAYLREALVHESKFGWKLENDASMIAIYVLGWGTLGYLVLMGIHLAVAIDEDKNED